MKNKIFTKEEYHYIVNYILKISKGENKKRKYRFIYSDNIVVTVIKVNKVYTIYFDKDETPYLFFNYPSYIQIYKGDIVRFIWQSGPINHRIDGIAIYNIYFKDINIYYLHGFKYLKLNYMLLMI